MENKTYLMGIDAGCTNSKVVIFDTNGNIVSHASTPSLRFIHRRAGFEEFDIDELWAMISKCIHEAIEKAEIDPVQIKGLGVTSFGNGVVFLDDEGRTLAPGCFSQDYRANSIIDMYKETGVYEKINDIVKGTLFAGEPGPILRWYKENNREIYDKIGGVLLFKDYIMYKLTGIFATDLNAFGGSFMVDMETMEYSDRLLELYGISELKKALPKLAENATDIVGKVTEEAAKQTGLMVGTLIAAGMMDILACLVGMGATNIGTYTAIAGSWCINETHSKRIIPNASSNMPYLYKGEYLNCSYTGASGSNYEWFTRVLGDLPKVEAGRKNKSFYKLIDEWIESVPIDRASVFFSPFVAQPSIHVQAKANFINIEYNTSYEEICYAVAEGVAFIHKHHIDFLKQENLPLDAVRLTGGIAKSDVWAKIFANVLQVPIERVECDETGALGAAIVAGIGSGVYRDYEDAFEKAIKVKEPVYPDYETFPIFEKRYREWSKIHESLMSYWNWKEDNKNE